MTSTCLAEKSGEWLHQPLKEDHDFVFFRWRIWVEIMSKLLKFHQEISRRWMNVFVLYSEEKME